MMDHPQPSGEEQQDALRPASPAVPSSTGAPDASTPAADAPVAAPQGLTTPNAPGRGARPRARTAPIVWGALILVFCAYVAVRAAGGAIDVTLWLIATIMGLGVLLLAVGIAVLVRGGRGGD